MKRILVLLLVVPLRLLAANGDITGVAVRSDGWSADVYIAGLNTNGTYSYGLGTNNAPTGAEKLRITLTSQGFDDTGTSTTVPRTVVGTYRVRKPYPDNLAGDETLDAGVLRVRIALSDYIYSGDSNLVATLGSGLYSQGGTNSAAASSVTVTNSSAEAYPKVIANWTWPGHQQVTGNTMRLRAVAFHPSAKEGRPVRTVRFIATDEHSHSSTTFVSRMTIDRSLGDALPFGEFAGDLDVSGFTQGDRIRADFAAFPLWGNSNSVLNTADGANARPPLYAPQTNLCDRTGAYGTTWAIVATNGVDATGKASTNAFDIGATNYFLTISGAVNAIAATNNALRSRNDTGGGVVYLKAGQYAWVGGTPSIGTTPATWLTITTYPGEDGTTTGITTQSGARKASDFTRIKGIRINQAGNNYPFYTFDSLWWDGCFIGLPYSDMVDTVKFWYITGSTITNLNQGFIYYPGTTDKPVLFRGNNLVGPTSIRVLVYTVVGNVKSGASSQTAPIWNADVLSQSISPGTPILYNNAVYKWTNDQPAIAAYSTGTITNPVGGVFANNLVECVASPGSGQLISIGESLYGPVQNMMIWGNTLIGQRENLAYNDTGTTSVVRKGWSLRGNLFGNWNIKSDTFTPGNSNRIGNWPVVFGVGSLGNYALSMTNQGVFPPEFSGLNSLVRSGTTNLIGTAGFLAPSAFTGESASSGGGNYTIRSDSIAQSLADGWALPFDIFGNARGRLDPPGVVSSASTRKSGGFFY